MTDTLYIGLTLLIQKTIEARSEEDYDEKRDTLIEELEAKGFSVNVESEDTDERDEPCAGDGWDDAG